MPLGLAKDSFLDLAALAESKNENPNRLDVAAVPTETETTVPLSSLGGGDGTSSGGDDNHSSSSLGKTRDSVFDRGFVAHAAATATGDACGYEQSTTTSLEALNNSTTEVATGPVSATGPSRKPATSTTTSNQQYSGFAADFAEYHNHTVSYDYGHDSYAAPALLGQLSSDGKGFWCCLFPWFNQNSPKKLDGSKENGDDDDEENGDENMMMMIEGESQVLVEGKILSRSFSKDEDEYSTGSEALGEKLTEKDRQAVLARLRLAPPDSSTTPTTTNTSSAAAAESDPIGDPKSLLNGIPVYDENGDVVDSKPKKRGSILKRVSLGNSTTNSNSSPSLQKGQSQGSLGSDPQQPAGGGGIRRRSLFPVYKTQQHNSNNNVHFAPMARVVTVKSKKDMTEEEKGDIWWQRSDYEDFRKTGRLITKAMLEGGSEIWLASNQSWLPPDSGNRAGTLKWAFSMAGGGGSERSSSVGNSQNHHHEETAGDKWWHKFGHSRRGLEHIASGEEGRQRQANVKTAIQSVLDEQRRQKMYHREDAEKLRMVSIQHTSWARDLALAAAASDCDAVKSNFDDQRKSREFYLLKLSRANKTNAAASNSMEQQRVMPKFMQPIMSASSPSQQRRLDAHTSPQLRFKQQQLQKQQQQQLGAVPPPPAALVRTESPSVNSLEPIHDPVGKNGGADSVAKRAAGFSHGPANEKVNMAAVLSGMGAIGAH